MKNKKKSLLLVVLALLLVCATIGGTLAYLTSDDVVTNTFTVGDVTIKLDEAVTNVDGVKQGDDRTDTAPKGNKYHLIPGSTYTKDPIVYVDNGSEACWLFVKVANGIVDIEADETEGYKKIHTQITTQTDVWTKLDAASNADYTVYYNFHAEVENGVDGEYTEYPVFNNFKIHPFWDGESHVTEASTVVVTAYAIQAENVATGTDAAAAATAWETLQGQIDYDAQHTDNVNDPNT